jgi:hypothetical protein
VTQALPGNVDGQYQTPYDYKSKIGQRKAVKGKRGERQCIQNNSIHNFTITTNGLADFGHRLVQNVAQAFNSDSAVLRIQRKAP